MENVTVKDNHSLNQAKAQFESIAEMVKNLLAANDEEFYDAEQTIQEDALSVEVRSDWHTPVSEMVKPVEYTILLCTGGPAVRIIGELSEYLEPETARIEHQDWYTSWQDMQLSDEEEETVLVYTRCFWFGE